MTLTAEFEQNILADWLVLVIGNFLVGIPAGNGLSLSECFHGFLQSFQENCGVFA
jgi:hypothetical protein